MLELCSIASGSSGNCICVGTDDCHVLIDAGISGTKIAKRDELQRLLKDCEDGKIDRVITKSISRFARNTTDCLEMVRRLSQLKISIYFEKENIDTDHMSSELMLSILSSIAESESRSAKKNRFPCTNYQHFATFASQFF